MTAPYENDYTGIMDVIAFFTWVYGGVAYKRCRKAKRDLKAKVRKFFKDLRS